MPRRIASNFAILGVSEFLCRGLSVFITIALYDRLKPSGFGRIEFAFNLVFWLILIVRDCFETIVTREIARHPRLTRGFVNHVLTVKLLIASCLLGGLNVAGQVGFANPADGLILSLYGLLLISTALGLDFVFRAQESITLVAFSLAIRTLIYCVGVWCFVFDASRLILVPTFLVAGELIGISLVWVFYVRQYGWPRLKARRRFSLVLLNRGKSVGLIHLCQAVLVSVDLLVVGFWNKSEDFGRYCGPHRMISAMMAFGFIFQQVMFPSLSRSWRVSVEDGRRLFDLSVRVLMTGFVPMAIGGSVLAKPMVLFLFPSDYESLVVLLGFGIWRAPLLCLAFLYQSTLIAMNHEESGRRLLVWGALVSGPLAGLLHWQFGLIGASSSVLVVGTGLVSAGYLCLAKEGRAPRIHHHVGRPILASLAMVPVSLWMLRVHVVAAVVSGALTYLLVLKAIGGLDFRLPDLVSLHRPTSSVGKEGEMPLSASH